jgi:hypothetical protein
MRIPLCRFLAALAAFGFPLLAEAQTSEVRGTINFPGRQIAGAPVIGAPFSAERVSERVQIGSDGTRFTLQNSQETIHRDSQGRTRTDRPAMVGPGPQPTGVPVIVVIQDPVAHIGYVLDPQNKVAHRVALEIATANTPNTPHLARAAAPQAAAEQGGGPNPGPRPGTVSQDLGQQVIGGVLAEGQRLVQNWPAGSVGNDRPFQTTSESWFSRDITETLLSKSTDPRSGENITRLINISRTEPSAEMFAPPADYSVVDETEPFHIQWTAARP